MRFYTVSHKYYCGIDLHTQVMYLCILNHEGEVVLHRNLKSEPQAFLSAIAPYREDLVVGAECIFCWYWLADLCAREGIRFVLGHALYMKAIHGGKVKPVLSLSKGTTGSTRRRSRGCYAAGCSRSPTCIRPR